MSAPREPSARGVLDRLLGAAVALGALAVLPLALAGNPGGEDLHVRVEGAAGHLLELAPETGTPARPQAGPARARVEAGPPSLLGRLELDGTPDSREPGLALRRWRAVYGSRWEREVVLPVLLGPWVEHGDLDACGIAVHVSAALLDPARGGAGLRKMVEDRLRPLFPYTIGVLGITVTTLPALERAEVTITPREDALGLRAVAHLADGTEVGARGAIALRESRGALEVEVVGRFEPIFAGPGRARAEAFIGTEIVNFLRRELLGQNESIVLEQARAVLAAHVAPVVDELNGALASTGRPFHPFAERPGDSVTLRLARSPELSSAGIDLALCASIDLGTPLVDAAIPGPPRVVSLPPATARGLVDDEPLVEIAVSPLGMNQLVFALWQTGQLRRWGSSTVVLDQLPADVKALSFDITGFDPRLPPVVSPRSAGADGAGLRIRVADVALGNWDGRTVTGHADVDARATLAAVGDRAPRLALEGHIESLWVDCVRADADAVELVPCLSDLLPAVRDRLREQALNYQIDVGPLLALVSQQSFQGLRLELSPTFVTTDALPAQTRARFRARVSSAAAR